MLMKIKVIYKSPNPTKLFKGDSVHHLNSTTSTNVLHRLSSGLMVHSINKIFFCRNHLISLIRTLFQNKGNKYLALTGSRAHCATTTVVDSQ